MVLQTTIIVSEFNGHWHSSIQDWHGDYWGEGERGEGGIYGYGYGRLWVMVRYGK